MSQPQTPAVSAGQTYKVTIAFDGRRFSGEFHGETKADAIEAAVDFYAKAHDAKPEDIYVLDFEPSK